MSEEKKIRVWADGCFDMMHFGHANALRQAKLQGHYLVVGVHSDEDIEKNKGPPVMNEKERYRAVAACKWVDEVVEGAPYVTSLEYLDKYNCDFCVHGDDIVTTSDGKDTYEEVKKANRFVIVPRTEGVSTTQLVNRMLEMTKDHHKKEDDKDMYGVKQDQVMSMAEGSEKSPYTGVSKFVPSSRKIVQFAQGREPTPDDKVVYVSGVFDLFHVGHIDFLEMAKKMGTYLIVGVLSDNIANEMKGGSWPIMNIHERVLSVLSCRYVDEVIIGAPWIVTEELIKNYNVSVVVEGTIRDVGNEYKKQEEVDPYEYPKKIGIFKQIESPNKLTASDIVERVKQNRKAYELRNLIALSTSIVKST